MESRYAVAGAAEAGLQPQALNTIPHPNALAHLRKAEARGRAELSRREGRELERVGELLLQEVRTALRGVAKMREDVHQRQRGFEVQRKQMGNEQVRVRARLEDSWLRGLEKILYSDFEEETKRIRLRQATADNALVSRGSAHNAALVIALNKSGYLHSRLK